MVFPMWEPPLWQVTFGAAISACDRGHQWERVGRTPVGRTRSWRVFWGWKKVALNGLTWFNYITKMWNMYHKWVVSLLKRMKKGYVLPTKMFVLSLFDPIWWYGGMVWELSINNGDNDQDVLLNVISIYEWMAMFVVCCCWIMRFWDP